jgi:ferredoxin/flavodoxin---NADP+ reductase
MGPLELMLAEHSAIKQVLSAWEAMGRKAQRDGEIDSSRTAEFLRFFRRFADHLHHGKEEKILFERLVLVGLDQSVGIVAQLLGEHARLRIELAQVESIATSAAGHRSLDEYLSHLEDYALLLRNHIRVEDDFLFGAAELLLDAAARQQLGQNFAEHDAPLEVERTELLSLGERLCRELSVPVPSWPTASAVVEAQRAGTWPAAAGPLRVAIVGAGPSGFFAAAALVNQGEVPVEVDLLDRLPSPYGLVRAGVAPDHDNIKAVARVFERCATRPGLSYFGNVELGRDIQAAELLRLYDDVVYATGSELDRRLEIPGDGCAGTTPASVFVGWYNAHPDYRDAAPINPNAEQVAVIGNGNVALDIARILAHDPVELSRTDIAEHALNLLAHKRLKRLYIIGRRPIYDAAFSTPELRELVNLEGVRTIVEPRALDPDVIGDPMGASSVARANWEVLREAAARETANARMEVVFLFSVSPEAILTDESQHARALELAELERVPLPDGGATYRASGVRRELAVGWIYTAIGYRSKPLPGVPYDIERGVILNRSGRVLEPETDQLREHEYCVGWAQSGPRGLIGNHKRGSAAIVAELLKQSIARGPEGKVERVGGLGLAALLDRRGVRPVGFGEWQKIDALEVERGAPRGAPRSKFESIDQMLAAAGLLESSRKDGIAH